ncbi:hypothetical protein J3F84DRAFT_379386 [Trichoderma pleuroticola]
MESLRAYLAQLGKIPLPVLSTAVISIRIRIYAYMLFLFDIGLRSVLTGDVFLVLTAFFDSAFRPVYPIFFSSRVLFCLAA